MMMKKYEYKKSFLEALKKNDMRIIYEIIKYLSDINGLKQALNEHNAKDLISILKFINDNWYHEKHTEINIEMALIILDGYRQFYIELKPYFEELADNTTKEMLFQQECSIVTSFIEFLSQ